MLIVGTGAMACLFGAHLARSGVDVTFLGTWPAGLEALNHKGLRTTHGERFPVRLYRHPQRFSRALVLVKAWQTETVAERLSPLLTPQARVLSLQNGLGHHQILIRTLGEERIEWGVTTLGACLVEPGLVQPAGSGRVFLARQSSFEPFLRAAGLEVESAQRLDSVAWSKLVINAAINPVAALYALTNGELVRHPAASTMMRAAAEEAASVARALGVSLLFERAGDEALKVALQTGPNTASMLADLKRGAPTEIDEINGAVVRVGQTLGVATPINQKLWEDVLHAVGRKALGNAAGTPAAPRSVGSGPHHGISPSGSSLAGGPVEEGMPGHRRDHFRQPDPV